MTTDTQATFEISDKTLDFAEKVSLADLLDCDLIAGHVIRSICIIRKELLCHPLEDEVDQRLEAKLSSVFHALGNEARNAAFTTHREASEPTNN
jgi:hypothetical protein